MCLCAKVEKIQTSKILTETMEKKVSIYLRPESINIKWRLKLKWTKKHCPDFSRYSYCSSFMILETQQVHFPSRDRKFSYTIYKKKVQTGMKNLTHSFAIRMYIRMNEYRRWKNRQISVEKVWLDEYIYIFYNDCHVRKTTENKELHTYIH